MKAAQALAVVLALAGAAIPSLAGAATASDLFYERTVMSQAGARCGLFSPPVSAALAAAQIQARGAALRSGVTAQGLEAVRARATAKADAADCRSAELAIAASRLRSAFQGYAQLKRMTYPGDVADWRADRTAAAQGANWRLTQDVKFGWDRMTFGLAGLGQARPLMAVSSFADGAAPYAARIVVRDVALTSGPYLDGRAANSKRRIPLPARMPPRAATRVFTAEARSPAGADLAARDMDQAWAFRFPAAATEALAGLDPREAVAVEFVLAGRDGDEIRTAYVEVGDFAAGRAFLTVTQR